MAIAQIYTYGAFYFVLSMALLSMLLTNERKRTKLVHERAERVVVLGGSSGIGKAIALEYARRGAHVLVVARRADELEKVREECVRVFGRKPSEGPTTQSLLEKPPARGRAVEKIRVKVADIGLVEDLVGVRRAVQEAWDGLDTLVLCAGISSLQPLMLNAGVEQGSPEDATPEGLAHLQETVRRVSEVNYVSSALVAATFFPMMERTSKAGAVMLISSAAALIPAPTRTLYCSSKAASLLLYQALAIEHPRLAFALLCPGTVNTAFRASAPDGDSKREVEEKKLQPEEVARRGVDAVDGGERMVVMPLKFRLAHLAYYLGGRGWIERGARRKYGWKD